MYKEFGISEDLLKKANDSEKELVNIFKNIDILSEQNSLKILNAFNKYKLSDMHFGMTTGYGYGDVGRDVIEEIYSEILGAEDSLVRTQFISGTHALTVALFSLLRPGETVLSINGKPYDTLDEIIGIKENNSSLKSYGIKYEEIDLVDNEFDKEAIETRIKKGNLKLIIIQRSKGYALRRSLSIEKIGEIIKTIKTVNKDILVMVDNCYGEFVEDREPTHVGADIIVGSLIKNLGASIAPNGAYIAGRKDLVELAAERLTSPGLGKEAGPTLGINRYILQGLYFAPQAVAGSLKTAIFASKMLSDMGYETVPNYDEKRTDIVQTIAFNNKEKVIKFCQGIQMGSPVDSNSVPEPWEMPGYTDKVIMAAGTFIQGASIELSCDAPIRPPYVAFLQGGVTYSYGKLGVLKAIQNII